MKADIQTCQDTFKIGYDAFVNSRDEARKVTEYFHNRHAMATKYLPSTFQN